MRRRRARLAAGIVVLSIPLWTVGLAARAGSSPGVHHPVGPYRVAHVATSSGLPTFGQPTISGIQGNGFEQGVQISNDNLLYTSVPNGIGTAASFIWRSLNGGKTFKWVPAGAPLRGNPPVCTQGGDTDIATDKNGRIYFVDLSLANFASARSDDRGVTFTPPNCTAVETTPDDRQWLTAEGSPVNGGTLYLAYNVVGGSGPQVCDGVLTAANQLVMARSPAPGAPGSTAGVQYGPSNRITGPCDEGIMGNVEVSPITHEIFVVHPNNRRTAIRLAKCENVPVTTDPSGLSCTDSLVTTFPTSNADGGSGFKSGANFPTLAIDRAGNLFAVWEQAPVIHCGTNCGSSGDVSGDTLLYWSSSADDGVTWTTPVQIPTPGLRTNVFAWAAAGDAGRVDVAWYGTDCDQITCADPDNPHRGPDSTLGHWSLYLTQTLDGLDAVPTFTPPIVASEHFVHFGSMFTLIGRQTGNRALGDFFQLRIGQQGDAVISYADSNNVAGGPSPHAMFVRQIGGSSVLASHPTVVGSPPPTSPVSDQRGDARYEADSQVSSNIPNLDILKASMVQLDASTYRIKLRVADLTSLAPPGPPDGDTDLVWLVQWLVPSSTDPDGGRFFFAYMESTAGGTPQFFDGVAQSTSDFYATYPGVNQITGKVKMAAPGIIQIDVPIADVTVPGAIGPTLFSVTASTMTLPQPANSSPGTNGVLFNLIDVVPAFDLTP